MALKPRYYETLYLIRPDIKEDDLAKIQDKLTSSINSNEGEILKNEKWADRDLAYPINDYTKGSYYILEYSALPNASKELEKHLSFHNTDVLRFITILNEDGPQPQEEKAETASAKTSSTPTKSVQEAPEPKVSSEPEAETTEETPSEFSAKPKDTADTTEAKTATKEAGSDTQTETPAEPETSTAPEDIPPAEDKENSDNTESETSAFTSAKKPADEDENEGGNQ